MCGSAPSAPRPQPNYTLMREAKEQRLLQAEQRAELKRQRFEAIVGMGSNRFGRASLITGSQGGTGYAPPRATIVPPMSNPL